MSSKLIHRSLSQTSVFSLPPPYDVCLLEIECNLDAYTCHKHLCFQFNISYLKRVPANKIVESFIRFYTDSEPDEYHTNFVQQGSLNADDVQVQENDEIVQEGQIDNQEPFVQNPMNEAEVYVHPPHEQDYVQEEHAQDFGQASQVNFHPPTLDPSGRYYWDYDQALWQPYHHNYETNYAPHDGQDDLTYTFTNL